jgi:hypothetical protein
MLQATHDLSDHVVGFCVGKGAVCVVQNQAYTDAFSAFIYPFTSVNIETLIALEGVPERLGNVFS